MSALTDIIDQIVFKAEQAISIDGPSEIGGTICVQGSKNATNKLVAAAVTIPGSYTFSNFPMILDPLRVLAIAEFLGASVVVDARHNIVTLNTRTIINKQIPYEMTRTTTSAFGLAGALLGRFGSVTIGKPGGDAIGPRPVDLHIEAFRSLGAAVEDNEDAISATITTTAQPYYEMRVPSVGAAVNYVLAACTTSQTVELRNAPIEGDMDALYDMLRSVGATIRTDGSTVLIGETHQHNQAIEVACPPDRNEAMTWLAFGAVSKTGLTITHVPIGEITSGIETYRRFGVVVMQQGHDTLLVRRPDATLAETLEVVAGHGRNFHSDWAPTFDVALCVLGLRARVIDTLFSRRIRQAELLQGAGAAVHISGGAPPAGIRVQWRDDPNDARYIIDIQPSDAHLVAIDCEVGEDVRACAAATLLASQASGTSTFRMMGALYRGYEKPLERLQSIGVHMSTN